MTLQPRTTAFAALLLIGAAVFAQQTSTPAPQDAASQTGSMQPPPPRTRSAPNARAPSAMTAAPTSDITGRVQQWLMNPNGDVDGLLLADGTQVGFPPHLSATMLQTLKVGDNVRVRGWRMPNGPVVRASSLTATASGRTVADQPPAPGAMPRAPRDPSALTAMSASGRVKQVLYTDRGDANGVLLDSGTIVRFPPRAGAGMAPMLKVGSTLSARGWGSRNAQGSALEATGIGASADTQQDLFAGPGREPPPPRDGPRAPRGPRGAGGPDGMRPMPPAAPGMSAPPPPAS